MIGNGAGHHGGAGSVACPLVFIPGLGDDAESWDGLAEELAAEHVCVALDHPTLLKDTSMAEMARAVRAEVVRKAPTPVVLVGCSMGSAICQEWVLQQPGDVAALVLIAGWAGPDPLLDLVLGHWIALAEAGHRGTLAASGAALTFSAAYLRAHPEAARECEIGDLRSYAAMARACRSHDARARLPRIAVPTLVVSGDRDRLVGSDAGDELASLIPDARREIVFGGHVHYWERPSETLKAIQTFLRDIGQ